MEWRRLRLRLRMLLFVLLWPLRLALLCRRAISSFCAARTMSNPLPSAVAAMAAAVVLPTVASAAAAVGDVCVWGCVWW